jgi:uncharacterized SAM-binding protein YcdF (DUF218 family)
MRIFTQFKKMFARNSARRIYRQIALALFACTCLALTAWIFRAPLLSGLASAWIVNDSPCKADAIVILGGGVQCRPFAAARLYTAGVAPKVLIPDVRSNLTDLLNLTPPEKVVTRNILVKAGIPDADIVTVGHSVSNTFQESLGARAWAKEHGAKRLIIATELFHTRRALWVFRKELKAINTDIRVVAVQPEEYGSTNWWRHEQGLIAFQTEWIKLPYYWLRY